MIGFSKAKQMDSILSVFTEKARIAVASEEEMPLCERIAFDGYIEILSHNSRKIRLTDKGVEFVSQGGYRQQFRTKLYRVIEVVAAAVGGLMALLSYKCCQ